MSTEYEATEYKIVLQQNIRVGGLEISTDLREEIDRLLGDCRDGRYLFYVEALQLSIASCVNTAVQLVVDRGARKEFGDEMVKVGPRSEASRAHLEAEKILDKMSINSVSDCRALSASAVDVEHELLPDAKWRVLCRDDRKEDGTPGEYVLSSRVFDDADAARADAEGISSSRFPIIVEASKADTVLGALNFKTDRRQG
jgi:hypothetical protein